MSQPADVCILIVSYGTRELTLACLRSVYAQTRGVRFEVVVVDNASSDGSADAVEAGFPQVRLIRLERNVGFARANNLAAGHAGGARFLLLLNPDTEVLEGAVQRLVAFAAARTGTTQSVPEIVGGRTFFADGSLNRESCHGRPTPWSMVCQAVGLSAAFRGSRLFNAEALGDWPRDTVREVDAITGCFLLIPTPLWHRLGGLDESFFMYGEETDLCLRARRLGARCVINPDAAIVHHGGRSEKVRADKMVRLFRAKAQLARRHWGRGTVWIAPAALRLWALTRVLAYRLATRIAATPGRIVAYETWRDVWRRRGEYGRV